MFISINDYWFSFFYNNKCKHSTTKMILREVLFNYKNKEMIEKVIINTESRKTLSKKPIKMSEILY